MGARKEAEEVRMINEAEVAEAPASKWHKKKCRVVNYVPGFGILGFDFDGVPCQIQVDKGLSIGNEVVVKYQGEIGKDIKFILQ